jgi:hypothetical protein
MGETVNVQAVGDLWQGSGSLSSNAVLIWMFRGIWLDYCIN